MQELIDWSSPTEQCDVQKFVEKYRRCLPLLVKIADGYAGRDEYAQNEVSHKASPFSQLIFITTRLLYILLDQLSNCGAALYS